MNNANREEFNSYIVSKFNKKKEYRTCVLCKFRKLCNPYNFPLNLIYSLKPCWIGTGPYDITISQVRVNQGVINCLQYF